MQIAAKLYVLSGVIKRTAILNTVRSGFGRRVQLPSGRICASALRPRQFRGIRLSRLVRSPSNLVRLWLGQAGIEVQNTFLLRR